MTAQVLEKPFECHTCKRQIRISKIEGAGPDAKKKWNRFELDGVTVHVCNKKTAAADQPQPQPQTQVTVVPETHMLAALAQSVDFLAKKVDQLTAEIQALRMELQKKK